MLVVDGDYGNHDDCNSRQCVVVPGQFRRSYPTVAMRGSTAGISDNFIGSNRCHYILLSVLDTLLSALAVSPAVVGYWRGTWMIMDHYVFPDQQVYSGWVSVSIGYLGHLLFTLVQAPMTRSFHPDQHRLSYYIASRVYTATFAFVCVNSWRGAWKLMEHHAGYGIGPLMGITVVSVIALAATRTLRNISAPPFSIATDECEGYFQVPTMFRMSVSCKSATVLTLFKAEFNLRNTSGS